MSKSDRPVRRSVTLPARVAKRIQSLAESRRTSASRVILELVESGLEAADREHLLDVADRLARAKDPGEQARLEDEPARLTFGD